MLKIIGCLIEFSTSESEPKHKMIPMNQSMCIYYSFFFHRSTYVIACAEPNGCITTNSFAGC